VKTDRRDAELLARLLLAAKLHAVRVPGPQEEALRDLVRAREQVRVDLMRCRHGLSKLLLRHGIRFDDGDAWTDWHRQWLNEIVLEWPAAQATLLDVRGGIDTLSAVGLCAEVGDFARFARAEQLMSYLGLVPSESTTGQQRRLGSITKTGSTHARRLLVVAAWHYRARPNLGKALTERQADQPQEAIAVAWTAQKRLHRTWSRLEQRGKRRTLIAVAAGRPVPEDVGRILVTPVYGGLRYFLTADGHIIALQVNPSSTG
jgi:transposase